MTLTETETLNETLTETETEAATLTETLTLPLLQLRHREIHSSLAGRTQVVAPAHHPPNTHTRYTRRDGLCSSPQYTLPALHAREDVVAPTPTYKPASIGRRLGRDTQPVGW
jgi:hypothetical protein